MHVFIDGLNLSSGKTGVQQYYSKLIENLADLDLRLTLYSEGFLDSDKTGNRVDHLPRYATRMRRRLFSIDSRMISRALSISQAQIFHSLYYSYPYHASQPTVVTAFDLIHERFPEYFNRSCDSFFINLKKRAFLNAQHIISISKSTKDDIVELYKIPPERVSVVHLGVDTMFHPHDEVELEEFRRRHSVHGPYVLFVGSRQYYKNFLLLLEAFFAAGLDRDFRLVAFGSPAYWRGDELQVLNAVDAKRQSRVVLGGYLPARDMPLAYSAASCLAYPSLYEGFGLPILEGLACGIPVICTRSSSLQEVGGDTAIYIDEADVPSLVSAMRRALSGSVACRVWAGVQWAQSFTWRRTAQRTKEVYEALIDC